MRTRRSRKYRKKRWFNSAKMNAWQKQYQDPRWKEYRQQILERDSFKCTECENTGAGVVLHVHHLRYYGEHIWDVEESDLVTLCRICHNKAHGRKF